MGTPRRCVPTVAATCLRPAPCDPCRSYQLGDACLQYVRISEAHTAFQSQPTSQLCCKWQAECAGVNEKTNTTSVLLSLSFSTEVMAPGAVGYTPVERQIMRWDRLAMLSRRRPEASSEHPDRPI